MQRAKIGIGRDRDNAAGGCVVDVLISDEIGTACNHSGVSARTVENATAEIGTAVGVGEDAVAEYEAGVGDAAGLNDVSVGQVVHSSAIGRTSLAARRTGSSSFDGIAIHCVIVERGGAIQIKEGASVTVAAISIYITRAALGGVGGQGAVDDSEGAAANDVAGPHVEDGTAQTRAAAATEGAATAAEATEAEFAGTVAVATAAATEAAAPAVGGEAGGGAATTPAEAATAEAASSAAAANASTAAAEAAASAETAAATAAAAAAAAIAAVGREAALTASRTTATACRSPIRALDETAAAATGTAATAISPRAGAVGDTAAKSTAISAAIGIAAHAAAAGCPSAQGGIAAAAADGLVVRQRHAVERQATLIEDRAARAQTAATAVAASALCQTVFQRHVVKRQLSQCQLAVHAARNVKQAKGRHAAARVALNRRTVAVDGQIAGDGRQRIGTIPVIVNRRQVVGAGGEINGVAAAGAVGGVDVGDQAGHIARADVVYRRHRAIF